MDKPLVLLLAEDEALIGLALEEDLRAAGYAVAGPFVTCREATTWLEGSTPHLALIDNLLQDGPCLELAHELRERNVPFAIYSGQPRSLADAGWRDHSEAPWIDKPARVEVVLGVLRDLRLLAMAHLRS